MLFPGHDVIVLIMGWIALTVFAATDEGQENIVLQITVPRKQILRDVEEKLSGFDDRLQRFQKRLDLETKQCLELTDKYDFRLRDVEKKLTRITQDGINSGRSAITRQQFTKMGEEIFQGVMSRMYRVHQNRPHNSRRVVNGKLADAPRKGHVMNDQLLFDEQDDYVDTFLDKFQKGYDTFYDDELSGMDEHVVDEPVKQTADEEPFDGFDTDPVFSTLPPVIGSTLFPDEPVPSYSNHADLDNVYIQMEMLINKTLSFEHMFFDFKKDYSNVVSNLRRDVRSIDVTSKKLGTKVTFLNNTLFSSQWRLRTDDDDQRSRQALKLAADNRHMIGHVTDRIQREQLSLNRSVVRMGSLFTPLKHTVDFLDRKITRVSVNTRHQFLYLNNSIYSQQLDYDHSSFMEDRLTDIEEEIDEHTESMREDRHVNRRNVKSLSYDLDLIRKKVNAVDNANQTCCSEFSTLEGNSLNESIAVLNKNMQEISRRMLVQELNYNLENELWTKFNFSYLNGNSGCHGRQYVRKTPYSSGRYVGAILCSRYRYKLTLADNLEDTFLDIGDELGQGEDHCEFIGGDRTRRARTNVKVSYTRGRKGFRRREWGEVPQRGDMFMITPSPRWYECGISIP